MMKEQFKIYRIQIFLIEAKIFTIVWLGVFCANLVQYPFLSAQHSQDNFLRTYMCICT